MEHESGSAAEALRQAAAARAAGRAGRPSPGWFGPARGAAFAVFATAAFGPWADAGPIWAVTVVVTAAVFVGLHWVAVRASGVIVWPPQGTPRERLLGQLLPVLAFGAGWLLAPALGHAAGAVAAALLGGAGLWAETKWRDRRARAAAA